MKNKGFGTEVGFVDDVVGVKYCKCESIGGGAPIMWGCNCNIQIDDYKDEQEYIFINEIHFRFENPKKSTCAINQEGVLYCEGGAL